MKRVFTVIAGDLSAGHWLTDDYTSSIFRSVDKKDEADMNSLEAIELINEEMLVELKSSKFQSLKSKFPRLSNYEYENLQKPEYSCIVYMGCRLADGREFIASVSDLEGLFYKSQVEDKTKNKQEDKVIKKKVFTVIAGDLSAGYWSTDDYTSSVFRSVDKKDEADMNSLEAIELINEEMLVELKSSKFQFLKSKFPRLSNYEYENLQKPEYSFIVYIVCRLADGREFIASLTDLEVFCYKFPVQNKIETKQKDVNNKKNNKQGNKVITVIAGDLSAGYWLTDDCTSSVFRSVDKKDEADMNSLEAIELINEEKLVELKRSKFRSLKSKFPRLSNYKYENLQKPEYSFIVYIVCRLADDREFIASGIESQVLSYKIQVDNKTNNKQKDKVNTVIGIGVFGVILLTLSVWVINNIRGYDRILTATEIKEGCEQAKSSLQIAQAQFQQNKTSKLIEFEYRYGKKINPSNVDEAFTTADAIIALHEEVDNQERNVQLWCKTIKPGTKVKEEGDILKIIND